MPSRGLGLRQQNLTWSHCRICADKAVWKLIDWFAIETGKPDQEPLVHEHIECLSPPSIITRRFDE